MAINTIGAGVILNEGQIDVDFRVEGNSATHTLFVEGETDRVGIGTSDPDGKLHIHTATAGSVTANAYADELVLENSDHGGLSILTPADKVGVIYFGDPGANNAGQIFYDHDNTRLGFAVENSNKLFIDTNGSLIVGDGGAEDVQIRFDGNALDFHIGLDDSEDKLTIGKAATLGTNAFITIDENGMVKLPDNYMTIVGRLSIGSDISAGAPLHIKAAPIQTSGSRSAQLYVEDTTAFGSVQNSGIQFRQEWQSGSVTSTSAIVGTRTSTSSGNYGGALIFQTRANGGDLADNMIIQDDGDVGIGTTSPDTLFHVSGTGADVISRVECLHSVSSAIIDIVSAADRDSILRFKEASTVKARIINDASTESLVITDGADTAVLYLEAGQVGIGTVPNKPLDIDADIAGYTLDILNADASGAEGMRIDLSGYAPNNTSKDFIAVQDSGGSKGRWYSNGDIYTTSGTDIQSLSDERLKDNIANYTDGLEVINSLQPRTYTWKDGFGDGKDGTRYGFIAQEIKASSKVTDNMNLHSSVPVREDDGDKYDELINDGTIFGTQLSAKEAILISAIKELSAKVTALENA